MYRQHLRRFSWLLAAAVVATSAPAQASFWQFVANGPNGERQVSPHYPTEKQCNAALKIAEAWLAKKYPQRYPLVGSCEAYR